MATGDACFKLRQLDVSRLNLANVRELTARRLHVGLAQVHVTHDPDRHDQFIIRISVARPSTITPPDHDSV